MAHRTHPRWTRRDWLAAASATTAAGATMHSLAFGAQQSSSTPASPLAMPGPFRGRVAAIEHSGSIASGVFRAEPIRAMMARGMTELTGAPDATAAWKRLFERGDVVGIKVNPVGSPHVISSPEVLREIIAGLESAGVRRQDIVVYDRYRAQFLSAGFD